MKIPRDRDGDFEPELIQRYERDISQIEERVVSMYAKGMTVRDIQSHLADIYGASISPGTISNMPDRVLPLRPRASSGGGVAQSPSGVGVLYRLHRWASSACAQQRSSATQDSLQSMSCS